MKKTIFVIVLSIFLLNLVNASVTCSSNNFEATYETLPTSPITITTSCYNNDLNNSVQVFALGNFFSLADGNGFTIGAGSTKGQINILLNSGLIGNNTGYITFTSGESIKIQINKKVSEPTTGCRLIEMPHTTNFRIKQGETSASGEIKVKASTECSELDFNVIEQTQMSKPMFLQSKGESIPGKEYSFTIGLDAVNVNTGTYQNSYVVSASSGNEVYQKTISLSTTVTLGDSPISNSSFADLPTCNIDGEQVLNQSYKFSCVLNDPNINVEVPYNDFFIGKNVNEVSGNFEYLIEPVKIGNFVFLATFNYKGLSIGKAFTKEIRVTPSATSSSGIDLDVLFYQGGEKVNLENLKTGETSILVKDQKTQKIVESFKIYLNGNQINNTFNLESDKSYELIVDSPYYLSNTLNFTVKQGSLIIEINPNQTYFRTGDVINLSSNVNGTRFLLNDQIINSPYTLSTAGNFVLKFVKEGYTSQEINISVSSSIRYLTVTPTTSEWKKGSEVEMLLNENASWAVYLDNSLKESGNGNIVKFKITDSGTYQVKANDVVILPGIEVKSKSIFSYLKFWQWKYYSGWIVLVVIILVIIFGYKYLFGEESSKGEVNEGGFAIS